jgi:hypothetical protein
MPLLLPRRFADFLFVSSPPLALEVVPGNTFEHAEERGTGEESLRLFLGEAIGLVVQRGGYV